MTLRLEPPPSLKNILIKGSVVSLSRAGLKCWSITCPKTKLFIRFAKPLRIWEAAIETFPEGARTNAQRPSSAVHAKIARAVRKLSSEKRLPGRAPGLQMPGGGALTGMLRDLKAGLRSANGRRIRKAAAAIAGAGSGLTPAGDDLLVGAIAGCRLSELAGILSAESRGKIEAAVLSAAKTKTHSLSFHFLSQAGRGLFHGKLRNFIQTMLNGSGREIRAAAKALAEHGASSGADTLAGIRLGWEATACRG